VRFRGERKPLKRNSKDFGLREKVCMELRAMLSKMISTITPVGVREEGKVIRGEEDKK
jgi:hypothetical protein